MHRVNRAVITGACGILLALFVGTAACTESAATRGETAAQPASARRSQASGSTHYRWLQILDGGALSARVIVDQGSPVPQIRRDKGSPETMNKRVGGNSDFPVDVYELTEDATAYTANPFREVIGYGTLPLYQPPSRMVILGDTGCRNRSQCCDASEWPFPAIARRVKDEALRDVSTRGPAIVLHVGDYLYRESRHQPGYCPKGPSGYRWSTWEADFFAPAKDVLENVPMIFVRGNHETCGDSSSDPPTRAWRGWFRFLDQGAYTVECQEQVRDWSLDLGAAQIMMVDTALEYIEPDMLDTVTVWKPTNGLLVTHVPFWALYPGEEHTERLAGLPGGYSLPPSVKANIVGHIHTMEILEWTGGPLRPPTYVVGGGGTKLDHMGGLHYPAVNKGHDWTASSWKEFGFATLELKSPWKPVLLDKNGHPLMGQ
ncbi:MAG: metallophosphoesterase [Chromatiaceae bacterium]|jgi:hypothetical protein|nr:metallophosphoesterase [Chromatiaceae bacterium]